MTPVPKAAWRRVASSSVTWERDLGVSDWFSRVLRFGILDLPDRRDQDRVIMGAVLQGKDELSFDNAELEMGCEEAEYYELVSAEEIVDLVMNGHVVSSAFVHWEGYNKDGTRKGFVQNFHIQSKQWNRTSTRMEKK